MHIMKFAQLSLVLYFMAVVTSCPIPAPLCYVPAFSAKYYNMITHDHGMVYVNLTKHMFTEMSARTGKRIVRDFKHLKHYLMDNDTCTTSELPVSHLHVVNLCLPMHARKVEELSGSVGLIVETWEVETGFDVIYRIGFFPQSAMGSLPLFSQELCYYGTRNLYLYKEHSTMISNQTVFDIPKFCSASSPALSSQFMR